MTRDHKGIAFREGLRANRPVGHAIVPDLRRKPATCAVCGRQIHYRRRTYGPRARVGGYQHTGDGLAQYRSWGIDRG